MHTTHIHTYIHTYTQQHFTNTRTLPSDLFKAFRKFDIHTYIHIQTYTYTQQRFTNTRTLPSDLFKAFRKFDTDGSGSIDIDEFRRVCNAVGMGAGVLTDHEVKMLFEQCDGDNSGMVDFAEFLRVVVGNLTGI
jgi:Ca2+-binding EF-hand superfamily protein